MLTVTVPVVNDTERHVSIRDTKESTILGDSSRKVFRENNMKVPNYNMPQYILEKWARKSVVRPPKEKKARPIIRQYFQEQKIPEKKVNIPEKKRTRNESDSEDSIIFVEEYVPSAPAASTTKAADDSVIILEEIIPPPKKKVKVAAPSPTKEPETKSVSATTSSCNQPASVPPTNGCPPVALGQVATSLSSFIWPNVFAPIGTGSLRPIVIDGSNVAMQFGKGRVFDSLGILLCARHFITRGHRVMSFVPEIVRDGHRRIGTLNPNLLTWMQEHDLLTFTPHRTMVTDDFGRACQQRFVNCYDDFFIIEYAHQTGGIIVSKDNYRDVVRRHPQWAHTINNRLLLYSWAGETFMVPHDPLGQHGPPLEVFLRFNIFGERVLVPSKALSLDEMNTLIARIDSILRTLPSRS